MSKEIENAFTIEIAENWEETHISPDIYEKLLGLFTAGYDEANKWVSVESGELPEPGHIIHLLSNDGSIQGMYFPSEEKVQDYFTDPDIRPVTYFFQMPKHPVQDPENE